MRSILCLAALASVPLFAAEPNSPLSEVVRLPEFQVFADRPLPPPEKWSYVRDGNFEVLSNTSDRTTKKFVKDFRDFQYVLGIVSPTARIRSELPLMVVLCGRGNQFEKFAVKPTVRSLRGLATSLVRDREIASVLVDFQARSIDTGFVFPMMDWITEREVAPTEEFFREYIHLSMSQLTPRPPAWLAEGLANIYSNIDYTNKWIEVGLPKSFANEMIVQGPRVRFGYEGFQSYDSRFGWPPERFSQYEYAYGNGGFFTPFNYGSDPFETYSYRPPLYIQPFDEAFAVNYDSAELTGRTDTRDHQLNNWQRQVTAFVHLGLYGENGKYRAGFLKFASRSLTEPVTEALFKECFGMSYRDMAIQLRGYTEWTRYTSTVYKPTKGNSFLRHDTTIEVRPATPAEVGRIKGETLRLAGQEDAARNEFVLAYLRGERDPQLLASLGLMARQRHDEARARIYLEAVAASPTVPRPRAYLELARMRLEEARQGNKGAPLSAVQAESILTPLFTARTLRPVLNDVYREIAAVWDQSAVPPTRANLAVLELGIRIFPADGELIYRTAALLVKHGYRADAAGLLDRALKQHMEPELRQRFETLRRQLDSGAAVTRPASAVRLTPESALTPELRERLTALHSARAAATDELRAKIASTHALAPTARMEALQHFAAAQAEQLRALDADANQLAMDLGTPPEESDELSLLAALDAAPGASADPDLVALRDALLNPQGLSPPQRGLVRELILARQSSAATSGAAWFFSPATARVRLPANLPAELAASVAAFRRDKDSLKQELLSALRQPAPAEAAFVRTATLQALAGQQAPRFATLEAQAETIRRELVNVPTSVGASVAPALPPTLADRLAAYQRNRNELQTNARRDLRALRSQLPAGAEIVARGEPPRLELTGGNEAAASVRTAIDTFNRNYAARFGALNRELVALRRELAQHAGAAPAASAGKSVDDLMQDFAAAAWRETASDAFRDARAAAFLPGLSPEQRRLLFDGLGERQPDFVLEY